MQIFYNFLTLPVFCVNFRDFSNMFKIVLLFPDWKMISHHPGFPVSVEDLDMY